MLCSCKDRRHRVCGAGSLRKADAAYYNEKYIFVRSWESDIQDMPIAFLFLLYRSYKKCSIYLSSKCAARTAITK